MTVGSSAWPRLVLTLLLLLVLLVEPAVPIKLSSSGSALRHRAFPEANRGKSWRVGGWLGELDDVKGGGALLASPQEAAGRLASAGNGGFQVPGEEEERDHEREADEEDGDGGDFQARGGGGRAAASLLEPEEEAGAASLLASIATLLRHDKRSSRLEANQIEKDSQHGQLFQRDLELRKTVQWPPPPPPLLPAFRPCCACLPACL